MKSLGEGGGGGYPKNKREKASSTAHAYIIPRLQWKTGFKQTRTAVSVGSARLDN